MADRTPGLSDSPLRRRQRGRNLALGLGLVALAVLFYLITIVKIGSTL